MCVSPYNGSGAKVRLQYQSVVERPTESEFMSGFELFPQLRSAIQWVSSHGSAIFHYGWNVVAAILLFFIGKMFASFISNMLYKILLRRGVDLTVVNFFTALVRYVVLAFAVVAALGRLGIETSSIIAVIGAAGLAIGLALQSSLSNFAAGVLLVSLRPFKAGEVVQIGAITGTIERVHIFSTSLLTADRKEVVIPNGKIIADNIINYSRHPHRRVDIVVGVGYGSHIPQVKRVISGVLREDMRIDQSREITVRLNEMAPSSLNFVVRGWVKNEHYWDVYFDLMENIKEALDENGIDIPYPHMTVVSSPPSSTPEQVRLQALKS